MLPIVKSDGRAVITIPDVQALTRHEIQPAVELRDALWQANDDDEVKVIILRADGEHFCPQLTAEEMRAAAQEGHHAYTDVQQFYYSPFGIYQGVFYIKKVIITEVQGDCAGAGTLLALFSDLTVASSDARFWNPVEDLAEANVVLTMLTIGVHRAKAWVLTGEVLSAEAAHADGLVNYVSDRGQLRAASADIGAKVTRMPIDALVVTKMGFNGVLDGHGVINEFEMAPFYAGSLATMHEKRALEVGV